MDQFTHWEAHLLQSRAGYKSTHPVLMLAVPWRQSLLSDEEQAVCSEADQGPPHHIKDKIFLAGFLRDNGESFT